MLLSYRRPCTVNNSAWITFMQEMRTRSMCHIVQCADTVSPDHLGFNILCGVCFMQCQACSTGAWSQMWQWHAGSRKPGKEWKLLSVKLDDKDIILHIYFQSIFVFFNPKVQPLDSTGILGLIWHKSCSNIYVYTHRSIIGLVAHSIQHLQLN